MGWQCVPQTVGCVRGDPKAGQKNRATGRAIAMEALEERASASTTLDRDRSGSNIYWADYGGDPRGAEAWEYVEGRADEWRSTYTDKNGKERSRRLPKQSVVAVATIIHPPVEVSSQWTPEQTEKFYADAWKTMEEIDPEIYAPKNRVYRARHMDEGREIRDRGEDSHEHAMHEARDADGNYIGSTYDAHWRTNCARQFAALMREKGWEIDDPELTDWDRYKSDPEYKAEIDKKRSRSGLSQKEYHDMKASEAEVEQLQVEAAEAHAAREKAERSRRLIEGRTFKRGGKTMLGIQGLEEERSKLTGEVQALQARKAELAEVNSQLSEGRQRLTRVQAEEKAAQERVKNLNETVRQKVNEAVQKSMLEVDQLRARAVEDAQSAAQAERTWRERLREGVQAVVDSVRQALDWSAFAVLRKGMVRVLEWGRHYKAAEYLAGTTPEELRDAIAEVAQEEADRKRDERLRSLGVDVDEPSSDSWEYER